MRELHPIPRRPRRLFGLGLSCGAALSLAAACGSGKPFKGDASAGSGGRAGSTAGAAAGAGRGGSVNSGGAEPAVEGGAAGQATDPPDAGGAGPGPLDCEAGYDDCNGEPADGCETPLSSVSNCGACDSACESLADCAPLGTAFACVNPVESLAGQRLELPCIAATTFAELCESMMDRANTCPKPGGKVVARSLKVTGEEGVIYNVTVRIRGVLEPRSYTGGTAGTDHFYVGGSGVVPSNYNTFSVTVSAPAQTYYLNHDAGKGEAYGVFALDHEKVIPVEGGATVKLQVVDPDCAMVKNCKSFSGACIPHVVPGVAPAPTGYDGQFAQLDVVSVVRAQ